MSIRYIVGNPGSGKSYLGAKVLYDAFLRPKRHSALSKILTLYRASKNDDKHKSIDEILKNSIKVENEFEVAYTNINEFKFELSDKILKLDFEELKGRLSTLYNEYKYNKDSNDAHLIELAKEQGLYKALFVIDEIHNFFDKDNEVLKWWLTYHRHLYQELYLITQDLDLVSNEYKKVAEYFYKAVDSAKRFFSKKFRYIQYSGYKLYQKDIIKKFHVNFEQEVFNLYHSGNNGLGKSAVKKFMWIALFFALIVFILFKILISLFFSSEVETNADLNKTQKIQTNFSKNSPKFEDIKFVQTDSDSFYYTFSCIDYLCSFKNSDDLFEKTLLDNLISKTEVLFNTSRTHVKGLITYSYLLKDDVFKPLNITFKQKGKTDEKEIYKPNAVGGFGFNKP